MQAGWPMALMIYGVRFWGVIQKKSVKFCCRRGETEYRFGYADLLSIVEIKEISI